ncbi:Ubiquitin fusion degradation protein 4 [Nowakowskiella sp. JEL0407]|nr:Ubiquitin fusion degradation protein 4 [Nowakowskiella sp. JEL0407]
MDRAENQLNNNRLSEAISETESVLAALPQITPIASSTTPTRRVSARLSKEQPLTLLKESTSESSAEADLRTETSSNNPAINSSDLSSRYPKRIPKTVSNSSSSSNSVESSPVREKRKHKSESASEIPIATDSESPESRKKRKAAISATESIHLLSLPARSPSRRTVSDTTNNISQMPKKSKSAGSEPDEVDMNVDNDASSTQSSLKKNSKVDKKNKSKEPTTSSSSSSSSSSSIKKGRATRNSSKSSSHVSADDDAKSVSSRKSSRSQKSDVPNESTDKSDDKQEEGAESAAAQKKAATMDRLMFGGLGGGNSSASSSGKFKILLGQLNEPSDPSVQLMALQDLSESLIMATEDMFVGGGNSLMHGFSTDEFVKALLKILKNEQSNNLAAMGLDDDIPPELLEEMGIFGGGGGGIMNPEIMLLAARCLSNLLEANPSSAGYIISNDGIKVFVGKLMEIEFIDLAEQILQVLEKISIEYPIAVLKNNGLIAVLQYIDFFSLHVQRKSITIAANICRGLSTMGRTLMSRLSGSDSQAFSSNDAFRLVKDTIPIMEGLLRNSDAKLVEQTVRSMLFIVEWVCRMENAQSQLETLVETSLLRTLIEIVNPAPANSSYTVSDSPFIFMQLVKILSHIARGSPKLGVYMASELGVIEVIRNIFTNGKSMQMELETEVDSGNVTDEVTDAVMSVVVSRPAEQILEVLGLASEILPTVPKNHEIWSLKKQLSEASRKMMKNAANEEDDSKVEEDGDVDMDGSDPVVKSDKGKSKQENTESSGSAATTNSNLTQDQTRLTLLKEKPDCILSYVMQLFPVLIEVFGVSVNPTVRHKVVECISKGVWHLVGCIDNSSVEKYSADKLGVLLFNTRGFGKLISELVGTQELAFAAYRVNNEELEASSAVSSSSNGKGTTSEERDSKDALFLVAGGVQIAITVIDNFGELFKTWFVREGVVSEMENILAISESVIEKDKKRFGNVASKPANESTPAPRSSSPALRLGEIMRDLKRLRDQVAGQLRSDTPSTESQVEAQTASTTRSELQELFKDAEELLRKAEGTVKEGGDSSTSTSNSADNASKPPLTVDTTVASSSSEKSPSQISPSSKILTGMRNVLEKLRIPGSRASESSTPGENPPLQSSTSSITPERSLAASSGVAPSQITSLNGEKVPETAVREWIIFMCGTIVEKCREDVNNPEKNVLRELRRLSAEIDRKLSYSDALSDENSVPIPIVPKMLADDQKLKSNAEQMNVVFDEAEEIARVSSGPEKDVLQLENLQKIANRFVSSGSESHLHLYGGVTGFELLESGLLDSIISYLMNPGVNDVPFKLLKSQRESEKKQILLYRSPILDRLRAFLHVFMNGPTPDSNHRNFFVPNALKIMVQRLQQCLSRIERFQVASAIPTSISSSYAEYGLFGRFSSGREQSNPAMQLARQIRIKLVAENPSDVPKTYQNVLVSIHAVATFRALQEYLRSRIKMPKSEPAKTETTEASTSSQPPEKDADGDVQMDGESSSNNQVEPVNEATTSENSVDEAAMMNADADQYDEDEDDVDEEMMDVSHLLIHSEEQQRRRRRKEQLGTSESPSSATNPPNLDDPVAPEAVVDVRADATKTSDTSSPPPPTEATSSAQAVPKAGSSSQTVASSSSDSVSASENFSVVFRIEGEEFPKEMTIFGAIYQYEQRHSNKSTGWGGFGRPSPNIWNKTYSVSFRKVYDSEKSAPAPEPAEAEIKVLSNPTVKIPPNVKIPFQLSLPKYITLDHNAGKILLLLRLIHGLNTRWSEVYVDPVMQDSLANLDTVAGVAAAAEGKNEESTSLKAMTIIPLPADAFQNNKITAKLNRQLDEPLIMASNVLPQWCTAIAQNFSFLVPFETRLVYLQSTSFGYSRSMSRWQQNAQQSNRTSTSRRDGFLTDPTTDVQIGRIQRQKVRIARDRLMDSMVKVMELYGSTQALLEVEYFDEVGTGLGPTLEFFSSVSKELRRRHGAVVGSFNNVKGNSGKSPIVLWRDDTPSGQHKDEMDVDEKEIPQNTKTTGKDEFVGSYLGLFPAPMTEKMGESERGKKTLEIFRSMGIFVSKALLDSRLVDLPFNPMFLEMVVGQEDEKESEIEKTYGKEGKTLAQLHLIKHIDPVLYKSLLDLQKYATIKSQIERLELSVSEKKNAIENIKVRDATLDDLCLDFTLPGNPEIELIEKGPTVPVTIHNVSEYISRTVDLVVGSGVSRQIEEFKKGFNRVFLVSDLRCFSVQELGVLVAGAENEDWSQEAISEAIKADHGYHKNSKTILNLIEMMSSFNPVQRREFLSFVTGSPKLPIGGFKALSPPLTVVCKMAIQTQIANVPPILDDLSELGTGSVGNDPAHGPDSYLPSVMTCVNYLKVPEYSSLSVMKRRFEVAVREGQGCFHLS